MIDVAEPRSARRSTPGGRRARRSSAVGLVLSLVALAGCVGERETDAVTPAAPTPSAPTLAPSASPAASTPGAVFPAGAPEVVASGFTTPWSVAFVDDTALVSQRDTGEILEIAGGQTRVVGEVPDVAARGEGGLLGIAYADDAVFAYLTTADGNRVLRFALEGEPGSFSLGSAQIVIDGIPSAGIHNGGRIAFGPDGMLYVTAGDAADPGAAQNPESLGGKILRVTPDGGIPDDNPFPGSPVWSLGHRNPQGIGWDADGTMFASEFGQDTWDELNIIEPGANYGWPEVEGIGGREGFIDPVQQWAPADASPSGLAVVEGSVIIANLRGQRLRVVPTADPVSAREYFVGEFGRLRDAVLSPDGDLWFVTSDTDRAGGSDDEILRVPLATG
ncbi:MULTISPECIES: sorbosone dehydrogenase family protein [Microbacterium]|uniref:PQQ-dependent sugar dehydrogenase n=1 Tax=Microbacterium TaxID=33882 RepID=UPI0027896297|nr:MULTISPECIES: PQQ-dependent sugar dehydrogenase [Microbacterium]MDQ1082847.1 glucose/arabinose dehydrogenase [Microbacterium sp. SORGH_AS_0344]MDQ1168384.1 glucose/arabinose dehydrogenase [Microbacterium proteolyticum]